MTIIYYLLKMVMFILYYLYSNTKIYINGVKQTVTDGLGVTTGVNNFFIGAGGWADYFHGYIDEISLYDTSLTGEQVGMLYGEFTTATP